MKYDVSAPATTGHPDFERVFRGQMNTLEWMPIFLPTLWLFALYVSDKGAAAVGVLWIVGRILYVMGYAEAAEQRSRGFAIQAVACSILATGALIGVIVRLVSGG